MKNKGFTLIELLGVIIILALLMIIVFPSIINSVKNSSNKTDDLTKELIYNAAGLFIDEHINDFPKMNGSKYSIELSTLVGEGLLTGPIKLSSSDADITNNKCIQVTYNNGYNYELKDSGACKEIIKYSLPEGYQQVEYIESTGTQYVLTEIYPHYDWQFELKFSNFKPGTSTEPPTFLSTEGLETNSYYALNQNTFNYVNVTDSFMFGITNSSNVQSISFNGTTIFYNDVGMKIYTPSTHTSIYRLVLFRNRLDLSGTTERYASFRLHSFKFFNATDILYNLVPCYRISDNVIGLYDITNNIFYANAGTGTFIKGDNV